MYVCINVCMYVCMCVCMYVWVDGWMDGWMDGCNVCMIACVYVCMFVCWYVRMHVCVYAHTYIYFCICTQTLNIMYARRFSYLAMQSMQCACIVGFLCIGQPRLRLCTWQCLLGYTPIHTYICIWILV